MSEEKNYDLVIIGGGPGGYVAAIRAAQSGLTTALIEAREVGGTCLNRGCIPTKTILHISKMYHDMLKAQSSGIFFENPSYDMNKIHERKDEVIQSLQDGIVGLLKANGVDTYTGKGQILPNNQVSVSGQDNFIFNAKNILLAIGATPFVPEIPGVELTNVVTSNELLEGAQEKINDLIIVGGGVIGSEMASIYNNLGVNVTIIESAPRILPTMVREVSQSLAMSFKQRGITIYTNATLTEMQETNQKLEAYFTDKKGEHTLKADKILLAIGRRADLDGVLADGVELNFDRGIVVDEHFQTSLPNVYAIGDCVAGNVQLAHVASAQATNVIDRIVGNQPRMNMKLIPSCVYTHPEIAVVGMMEDEAKAAGINVKSAKYITSGNAKSIIEGQERGFIKIIYDSDLNTIIGAVLFCERATDMISQLTVSIGLELSVNDIASFIQPHPSYVEGIGEALESIFGHAVHVAPTRKR